MNVSSHSTANVAAAGSSVYMATKTSWRCPGQYGYNNTFATNAGNPYTCSPYGGGLPASTGLKHGSITRTQAMLYCSQPCTYNGFWTGTYTMGWLVNFCSFKGAPVITDIYHHGDPYDWHPTALYRYTTCLPSGGWHWTRDWCGNVKGTGYQANRHANTEGYQSNSCNGCSKRIACGCYGGLCTAGSGKWGTGWTAHGVCGCGGAISMKDTSFAAIVTYYGAGACYNDTTYNWSRIDGNSWRGCMLYTPGAHWRHCQGGQPQGYCTGTGIVGPSGGACVMAQSPRMCTGSSTPFGIGACGNPANFPHRAFGLCQSIARTGQLTCHCSSSLWSTGLGFWGSYYYQYGYSDISIAQ